KHCTGAVFCVHLLRGDGNMKSQALYWTAVGAVLAGGFFWRSAAFQQATPVPASVTLLLTFGQKARQVEKWDGTARVSGGTLVSTAGRHFSGGDAITGPGAWKCVTRRDEVAPFADIHYTEMRPGDKPEVLFHPVGVFLTL